MTTGLEGGEWSAARPGRTLPSGKTQYPFYRRLGGPQGQCGRAENLVPTGIRSRTVQPVVSRYTDWATGPTTSKINLKQKDRTGNLSLDENLILKWILKRGDRKMWNRLICFRIKTKVVIELTGSIKGRKRLISYSTKMLWVFNNEFVPWIELASCRIQLLGFSWTMEAWKRTQSWQSRLRGCYKGVRWKGYRQPFTLKLGQ